MNLITPARDNEVGIGSTVWVFDINRRIYAKTEAGRLSGAPIWREHWRPTKVTSETSRSWVLRDGTKVPKKGADPFVFAFSEEDIIRREWVENNGHRIGMAVGRINDYALLAKVATLIGYEPGSAK